MYREISILLIFVVGFITISSLMITDYIKSRAIIEPRLGEISKIKEEVERITSQASGLIGCDPLAANLKLHFVRNPLFSIDFLKVITSIFFPQNLVLQLTQSLVESNKVEVPQSTLNLERLLGIKYNITVIALEVENKKEECGILKYSLSITNKPETFRVFLLPRLDEATSINQNLLSSVANCNNFLCVLGVYDEFFNKKTVSEAEELLSSLPLTKEITLNPSSKNFKSFSLGGILIPVYNASLVEKGDYIVTFVLQFDDKVVKTIDLTVSIK